MKLILFRHGLAVEREEYIAKKIEDTLRPLTEKGAEKTRKMTRALFKQISEVQLLVSSSLIRSQQTADVIGEIIPFERFMESAELAPEAPPRAFANWLKTHAPQATSVLVVGHEPQLGIFASWLLSGSQESFLDFKKSGVIILEVPSFENLGPSSAQLKCLIHPKWLN